MVLGAGKDLKDKKDLKDEKALSVFVLAVLWVL
jgi:hypothetical protein